MSKYIDNYTIKIPDTEEAETAVSASYLAMQNGKVKARGVSLSDKEGVVIGCDTIVVLCGKIYGKPSSFSDGVQMLMELSGKTHTVYSGVCVRSLYREICFVKSSYVTLKSLTKEDIINYINKYSPLDKAGCYGIQDEVIVSGYEGDYYNIMGLPIDRIMETLKEFGYDEGKGNC